MYIQRSLGDAVVLYSLSGPAPGTPSGSAGPDGGAGPDAPVLRVDPDPRGRYRWTLFSRNGRPLARSAAGFPDSAAARAAFARLVCGAAELTIDQNLSGDLRSWVWTARDAAGRLVARGAATYRRRGACRAAATSFVVRLGSLRGVC
ncbi:hypothetical protein [Peterkaempfera sp. SMS 1(5)a]|uniref:hypothetical protein n=1 Tax=Peterkaempfera podocarpi TaxID=3232308 RepID=UPI00366C9643